MNVCNARWRLQVPLHGRGASRGTEARVRMCKRMRTLPYTSTAHDCTHTLALVGTEPGIYVVHWGPCSLAYVGQQSHTRYYSCVTNACIRPTAAATAACTCTHRDGKCSQCTNLRSLLERPPAILLCILCVCVYMCVCICVCVCASVPGSKPRKLSLSRPSFFEVLALYLDTRGICFIKRDAVLVRRKRERESFPDISLFLFSSLGYFFSPSTRDF